MWFVDPSGKAFIQAHDLPNRFLFDRYLSFKHRHFVLETLHVSVKAWCALVVLFLVDLVVVELGWGPVKRWLTGDWEFM